MAAHAARALAPTSYSGERAAAVRWRDACLQELGHALVGVDLVLDAGEAVAFVFVHFVFRHSAAFLDCIHHLLGFFFGTSRIIAAGQQQQRRFDLVHEENRRAVVEQVFVLLRDRPWWPDRIAAAPDLRWRFR